jgi:hypothetical protein
MIGLAPGTKVFLACQPIDFRAAFDGLSAKVQHIIGADLFSGRARIKTQEFIERGGEAVMLRKPRAPYPAIGERHRPQHRALRLRDVERGQILARPVFHRAMVGTCRRQGREMARSQPARRRIAPARASAANDIGSPLFAVDLSALYVGRGLDPLFAGQVADQLTAHDTIAADARDELGISKILDA